MDTRRRFFTAHVMYDCNSVVKLGTARVILCCVTDVSPAIVAYTFILGVAYSLRIHVIHWPRSVYIFTRVTRLHNPIACRLLPPLDLCHDTSFEQSNLLVTHCILTDCGFGYILEILELVFLAPGYKEWSFQEDLKNLVMHISTGNWNWECHKW